MSASEIPVALQQCMADSIKWNAHVSCRVIHCVPQSSTRVAFQRTSVQVEALEAGGQVGAQRQPPAWVATLLQTCTEQRECSCASACSLDSDCDSFNGASPLDSAQAPSGLLLSTLQQIYRAVRINSRSSTYLFVMLNHADSWRSIDSVECS